MKHTDADTTITVPESQPEGQDGGPVVTDEQRLSGEVRGQIGEKIPDLGDIFKESVLTGMKNLDNAYHNNVHAGEVIQRSERLARNMMPEASLVDMENMRIAALYHDAGHAGVTVRGTSPRDIPRKDLSNEQYAVELLRRDLGLVLPPERLTVIEGLILSTTFGQNPHPHPPTTPLEKIIVLADVGGFMEPFDHWVEESLLVLQETAPANLPADFAAWQKNRIGFLDGYVRGLLTQAQPHLQPAEYERVLAQLDATVALVKTDLGRFEGKFLAVTQPKAAA